MPSSNNHPSPTPIVYPRDIFFDIETLINVAQPSSILLIGNQNSTFLDDYIEQKALLNQDCKVTRIDVSQLPLLNKTDRHDVGIAIDVFEHIDKQSGVQLLSRLRDLLCHQYCICLPIKDSHSPKNKTDWQLTEMFGFALERVALYDNAEQDIKNQIALFKYNISDYKKTPDWLNSNNWANPEMWGKYWW